MKRVLRSIVIPLVLILVYMSVGQVVAAANTGIVPGNDSSNSTPADDPEMSKMMILLGACVPGNGILKAPGLEKTFNENSQAWQNAGGPLHDAEKWLAENGNGGNGKVK